MDLILAMIDRFEWRRACRQDKDELEMIKFTFSFAFSYGMEKG